MSPPPVSQQAVEAGPALRASASASATGGTMTIGPGPLQRFEIGRRRRTAPAASEHSPATIGTR